MANYNDTLNLYKQLQQNGTEHVDANFSTPSVMGTTVEALDEAVYGAYDDEQENSQGEGQKRLIETMKEVESGEISEGNMQRIQENIKNLKLPAALLQDMINNPLIYTKVDGDDIDQFAQRVLQSSAGVQKSSKIIEKLEKNDAKIQEEKRMQQPQQNLGIGMVDYEKISQIVESIVSNRLAEFEKRNKNILNESTRQQTPFSNIKVLQLKENGSFLMLDTDDNIYECVLKYKGKNKKKR